MLWRRFLILSDSTSIRKKDYAVPRLGGRRHDALKITLLELHFRIKERFLYEDHFCDLWQHQVRFEKRLEIEASRLIRCVCVCVWEVNGQGHRRIAGDRKRFWTGARPLRGE